MENNNYGNSSIAKKLVKVMQECSFVPKNGTNSYHNYKYATAEDVLSTVNKSLAKYGIACIVIPTLESNIDVVNQKGNIEHLATVSVHIQLIDSESGDWLADEERFNDEEPLWFSESNHRISPVRVVLNARDSLSPQLSGSARGMDIKAMVVIRQGTIINAEDMFEVWNGLNVTVCRHEEGGPDEIVPLQSAVSSVTAPDDDLYHGISGLLN